MDKIVAVVGPTASGKTALAIEIAKKCGGEIISCDSMQIYRKMNIGTAKPPQNERLDIPHHMIDIIEPNEEFSCMEYASQAHICIRDIIGRNKLPIFCGGTGLYLDSVLTHNKFVAYPNKIEPSIDLNLDDPYSELKKIDPESAEKIHPNNIKRVTRALEIYYLTGKTKTEWDNESRTGNIYDPVIIGLDYKDRNILYDRINQRVDMMVAGGLFEEVKPLMGILGKTSGQAIGYKELILSGNTDTAIDQIKLNTRHYAKRQLTWFRRNKNIIWFFIDEYINLVKMYEEIVNKLESLLTK